MRRSESHLEVYRGVFRNDGWGGIANCRRAAISAAGKWKLRICVCVACVCACVRACMCVCMKERERQREKDGQDTRVENGLREPDVTQLFFQEYFKKTAKRHKDKERENTWGINISLCLFFITTDSVLARCLSLKIHVHMFCCQFEPHTAEY